MTLGNFLSSLNSVVFYLEIVYNKHFHRDSIKLLNDVTDMKALWEILSTV